MKTYHSKPSFRNLWQRYQVLNDRVELKTWIKTITIPLSEIESIEMRSPPVFLTNWKALKLDLADIFPHVGIRRKSGIFKELRFTPERPEEFIKAVQSVR